jgi:hypothetical protein
MRQRAHRLAVILVIGSINAAGFEIGKTSGANRSESRRGPQQGEPPLVLKLVAQPGRSGLEISYCTFECHLPNINNSFGMNGADDGARISDLCRDRVQAL